jgi:hypothetical protein
VRLDDDARVIFDAPYRNEHVTLGYAVTVHSAQGVTADTTHAVLGDSATRSLFYVAMTRGRQANNAYLYEHTPNPRQRKRPRLAYTCRCEGPGLMRLISPVPSWPTMTHSSPHTNTPPGRHPGYSRISLNA